MAVYKQPKSKNWWYKLTWNTEAIRESTKQTNKRVAEQMEAAHKTALAKGEVGIRDRKPVATLTEFAERDFLPFVRATFSAKPKTASYYEYGVKRLLAFERLATAPLDAITTDAISAFVAQRKADGLEISSINRELEALRRMFHLAQEWGKVEKALPKVKMIPGERHRERVLTANEESLYFTAAKSAGMQQHADPLLLWDVASGLRPEECFRLRRESVRDGVIEIQYGKTDNARRRIPTTPRVRAILEMRLSTSNGEWVFPAHTKSGHIEPSSVKKQQIRAFRESGVQPFELYNVAPYVPDPLGTTHGPMDTGIPRGPSGHEHHEAVRTPGAPHDYRGNGTRARCFGWAYFLGVPFQMPLRRGGSIHL